MITYEEAVKIVTEVKEQNKAKIIEEVRNFCETQISNTIKETIQKGKTKITIEIPAEFSEEQRAAFIKIFNENGYQKHMQFIDNNKFVIVFK